jgi:hypothetical protein
VFLWMLADHGHTLSRGDVVARLPVVVWLQSEVFGEEFSVAGEAVSSAHDAEQYSGAVAGCRRRRAGNRARGPAL